MSNKKRIIEGLVGEDHRELYLNNAWFHSGIEGLASFTLYLVKRLALDAEKKQRRFEQDVSLAIRGDGAKG